MIILSSDEYHAFRIFSSPKLLDLMLAHIGFFGTSNINNYRDLYENIWYTISDKLDEHVRRPESSKINKRNFIMFWHNAIKLPDDENKNLIKYLMPKLNNDCKLIN